MVNKYKHKTESQNNIAIVVHNLRMWAENSASYAALSIIKLMRTGNITNDNFQNRETQSGNSKDDESTTVQKALYNSIKPKTEIMRTSKKNNINVQQNRNTITEQHSCSCHDLW